MLPSQGHRTGFGATVNAVLDRLAPSSSAQEWLWLLHDDAEPAPNALAELLTAAERAPSVTIAGCKQLDWDERRRLVDVGLSTSRRAQRVTLIENDEQDQGQYDGRSDVLAVNSAGLLIRRSTWEALGGFDPALPGPGDDVDLGWRNWLAGNRVVVVPSARMFHADRPEPLGTQLAARRAEVYLRLKHSPWWQVPFLWLGALLGGVFALVAGIAMKDPRYGFAQLAGTLSGALQPMALRSGRASAAQTRTRPRSVVGGLQSSGREIRAHRRSVLEAMTGESVERDTSGSDAAAVEPSGDALEDFEALATTRRLWSGTGALVSVLLLTAAAFLAFFRLLGASAVSGGALLPLSGSLGAIWNHASGWWISLGAGLPGHGDPFGYVLWLIAAVGFGHGSAAVAWLLILALPVAGLGAWFAVGALTLRQWPRFAAALVWAGAPALQVALGQGRLGALLAHLLLPWAMLGLLRAVGGSVVRKTTVPIRGSVAQNRPGSGGVPSWTAAAAGGLVLAAVTASAPILLVPTIVVVVLATVVLRRRARTLWWSLLPSLALYAPVLVSALGAPRALLADPSVPLPFTAAPLWQQILGQPIPVPAGAGISGLSAMTGGSLPWGVVLMILVAAPVLLLALVGALLPGRGGGLARACWLIAAVGLLAGYAGNSIATAVDGSVLVPPFSGPTVSLVFLMLLAAGVRGVDALHRTAANASASHAWKGTAWVLSAALVVAPVLSIGVFTARSLVGDATAGGEYGAPFQVAKPASPTLPATASDRGTGPERSRTLVLTIGGDGAVAASLMRGSGTTLDALSTVASATRISGGPGAEHVSATDPVDADLRSAVAAVVAGTGVDPRPSLIRLGVGFVVLKQGDTAAELLAGQIDAVPGLATVGPTEAGWLWRVLPDTASTSGAPNVPGRARLQDASGATTVFLPSGERDVDARIAAGPAGRVLVLAERSDPAWTAEINGQRLAPVASGWAQAFAVPAAGGDVEIRYDRPWALFWNILQIVVLGLTALLAIPLPVRNGPRRLPRSAAHSRNRSASAPTTGSADRTVRLTEPVAEKAGSRG